MSIAINKKITGFAIANGERPGAMPQSGDLVASAQSDPDRRLVLKKAVAVAVGSARWPRRPHMPAGNEAWTFKVQSPANPGFYVTVGHYSNGHHHPFEVFANGDVPRGIGPLPWLLSRVMRSTDRHWLLKNLRTLAKVTSDPYDITMPDGRVVHVGGDVAALAAIVQFRCKALGYFDDMDEKSPMLDAMMAPKEPKTDANGCATFSWDIKSATTADDGLMTIKEGITTEGTRVPISIWLSGSIEKDWDGLSKLLSLQMQVSDLDLIATTLQELEQFHERNGEYGFADDPGTSKQRYFPSTIAYIATLLRSRYQSLGLFDATGMPTNQLGLFFREDPGVSATVHQIDKARSTATNPTGSLCSKCGEFAVVFGGGCHTCTACSFSTCG
ncbi:MAG: hypothetical protein BGP25_05070 [Lysobacterales bacterium 63-13]|nr:MAG: hypothetical protein BGP25_05070 [Xanthomonadales bacterium 63-13]